MKTVLNIIFLLTLNINLSSDPIDPDDRGWPRDITFKKGVITIYQPQIESYENNIIEARAALAVKVKDKSPVFGAMWFTCRTTTDKDLRLVVFDEVKVESLKFPEGDKEEVENLRKAMTEKLNGQSLTISLDRFAASIEHLTDKYDNDADYNNMPPKIYFETSPSVLVFIDGDPIIKEAGESGFKYVMNTPFFLVQHPKDKQYYLKGGVWWYSSKSITNGWNPIENPPADVKKLADEAFKGETTDMDSTTALLKQAPKIIVSTKPAELIQTDGEPQFEPVPESELLFLTNSENDIIMDIESQQYYILISGRWYRTKDMTVGNWEYVSPADLPEEFGRIPVESDISGVRFSIPGTQESKDALLENAIPQTAEIDRKKASVEVKYDGNPKFSKIENTAVSYAENSDKTVLLINNKYYCVDDAIWFVSSKASGPWQVCVEVPVEVQDIPPSAPVYNVKYVYVYDYTPSVVYVGYTSGYYGSYVYNGTVIYGTGYWYQPWYSAYYYPRPVTWGFGVHYNPWTGWGYSVGISYGWISFGWHPYYSGWWGPAGYRYGYRHGYYHGYHHGYGQGFRYGYNAGRRAGNIASPQPATRQSVSGNIYQNRNNGVANTGVRPSTGNARPSGTESRPATRPATTSNRDRTSTQPAQSGARDNNVYSDSNGNIYRRDNSGDWQQRSNGQWNSGSRQTAPNQNLNRDYNNRSYGNQRTNSYRGSQMAAPRARPGGGGRMR